MPTVSPLKEAFAFAPIGEREKLLKKFSSTQGAWYYSGLVILQKLYDEIMKTDNPLAIREPTKTEAALIKKFTELMEKYKQFPDCNELNTRFQLLTFPIQASESTEYMQKKFELNWSNIKEDSSLDSQPSKLDLKLIDSEMIIKDSLKNVVNLDIKYTAIPIYAKILAKEENYLSDEQLVILLRKFFDHPTENFPDVLELFVKLWKKQKTKYTLQELEAVSYDKLTLKQLIWLSDVIPEIVFIQKSFIQAYLEKLIPYPYYFNNDNLWDDDQNYLLEYLNRAEEFIEKLPKMCIPLKAAVKFHKLRNNIARNTFYQEKLVEYLALFKQLNDSNETLTYYDFPLFDCEIHEKHSDLVVEYLTGLTEQEKLTETPRSLSAYEDYKYLEHLFAEIRLTTGLSKTEDQLTESEMTNLTQKSILSFSPCSLHQGFKRKSQDDITLTIKTKNIPHFSVRVFQIDTETYWRSNPHNKITQDINLDGLYPIWEEDLSFPEESPLLIKQHKLVFGKTGTTRDLFAGRGIWVIELVGGSHQCRAIIQKGYLRHIVQKTTAGYLLKVIDEYENIVESPSAIFCDQVYQADESHNILVPYVSKNSFSKSGQMLLVSPGDGFCEPINFYQECEKFMLKALYHVNYEMVSFNKKSTVVFVPHLTLNYIPYFTIESATLQVTCKNVHQVETKMFKHVSSIDTPIIFDFSVPELLTRLEFDFKVKVKTLDDSIITVSCCYTYPLNKNQDQPTNVCLKRSESGKYLIYALGANGEPKSKKDIPLSFNHRLSSHSISTTLQSNNEGIIDLGELKNITSVKFHGQNWDLNPDKSIPLIPSTICVEANKPFYIQHNNCCIYKTGYKNNLLESISKGIVKENDTTVVSGLSEGEYRIFLQDHNGAPWISPEQNYIRCVVVGGKNNPKDKFWKNWMIGKHSSIQQSDFVLQRPLEIVSHHCTDGIIDLKLANWSPNTFAIVSSSTFIPTKKHSLLNEARNHQVRSIPEIQKESEYSTRFKFFDDKEISQEYQYILNRVRSEKWAGSNLTPPSILIHPKKNNKILEEPVAFKHALQSGYLPETGLEACSMRNMCLEGYTPQKWYAEDFTSFAFLNHVSPIMVAPVNPISGHILIDSKKIGDDGGFLECIVISDEQTIYKEITKTQETMKYNDIRQHKNNALVRSKAAHVLSPNDMVELEASEIETVDTVEKLLKIIDIISPVGKNLSRIFKVLSNWQNMDFNEKAQIYNENVCHELNFWLKKNDFNFFKDVVYTGIKSKIRKEFMDLYLLEKDLSMYRKNTYAFEELNIAEKALLAKSQPQEFLETVLKSFENQLDVNNNRESDAIFDAIFAASALDHNQISSVSSEIAYGYTGELNEESGRLRKKARKLNTQDRFEYNFIKPTVEWIETGHFSEKDKISVNRFWVDYLSSKGFFLSENFVYSLKNNTEIFWVICLMDLPFVNQWEKSYSYEDKRFKINSGDISPLLVFYRQMVQITNDSATFKPLVICEEIFVHEKNIDVSSDECIKIDPQTTSLEPQTRYGCQVIVSNLSSKTVHCDLTYQVPTGSIPIGSSSYRFSQSITIKPYSTWSKVTGDFYFPYSGTFSTIPAVASIEKEEQRFLAQSSSSNLSVIDGDSKEGTTSTALHWPSIALRGSNEEVLSFLTTYKRLKKIDFSLITWRMSDISFARKIFDLLSYQRHFFSQILWNYGLYHHFSDIIKDLLEFDHETILKDVGQTFESPLVSIHDPDIVYDYFPLINARTHSTQPTQNNILNDQFNSKYSCFLDYLCEKTTEHTVTDLIMLTQYMVLQNRIGEAHAIFSRIDLEEARNSHPIQFDYLDVYLKTRISVSGQDIYSQLDLAPIKEVIKRYQGFGIRNWRDKFDEIYEFVCEIEQGYSSKRSASSISLQPILDFDINSSSQEIVIKHANINSVTISYYEMNIEVMFSENPFMSDAVTIDSFKLIKPTSVESIELNKPNIQKEREAEDFDVIGLGKIQYTQTSRVPFRGNNKNMMIEIKSKSFTPDAVTTRQRVEKARAHYSNNLDIDISENFGIVRVIGKNTKRPMVGAYVKAYARLKDNRETIFWKDGYTGLNGVFDYMNITEGNTMISVLGRTSINYIDKLSLLIMTSEGTIVKEVGPPLLS